jgi:hypothetical protein
MPHRDAFKLGEKIEILGRRYEVMAISDDEVALKHLPDGTNGHAPLLRLPLDWGDGKLKTK